MKNISVLSMLSNIFCYGNQNFKKNHILLYKEIMMYDTK